MKRLLLSSIALLGLTLAAGAQQKIFVSPGGSDKASGDEKHPLATLSEAVARARASRPAEVILAEGEYRVTSPVCIGPEDSGLSIKGAGAGRTVISGGVNLPPFEEGEGGMWRIDLSSFLPLGGDIQQLFVSGRRAVLARTPNGIDTFKTLGVDEIVIDTVEARSTQRPGFAIQKMPIGDDAAKALSKVAPMPSKMKVNFYHAWDITKRTVCSIDHAGKMIYVSGGIQKPWNKMGNCSQFIFEDDFSFLDEPGEWFFDNDSRVLWYMPREGETIASARAVVPSARQLLSVSGTEASRVKDISVEGISFEYTAFTPSWRGCEPEQAAAGTDATVAVEFTDGFTMKNCEILHTGNNGVWLANACRGGEISHCLIHDIGIGAVKLGTKEIPEDETSMLTRNITVCDNILSGGGHSLPTGEGVLILCASDCSVVHNEISDFFYTGISVGWVWGYTHSPTKRNDISYNHIHHIGWGLLSDMGGIYTLGLSEGTTVRGNVIHHIYAYGYGGWGLYTDEGSTEIVMEENLVYNCKSAGFHQHYGERNIIRNNIFVDQLKEQLACTRVEDHLSFTFTGNVIYYKTGTMYSHSWEKVNFESSRNLYWNADGPVSFNGLTLAGWQAKTGKDKGSVIADPKFSDIEGGDFTMKNRQALRKIGFKTFDSSVAGVRGDEAWKAAARLDPVREAQYDYAVNKYESTNE